MTSQSIPGIAVNVLEHAFTQLYRNIQTYVFTCVIKKVSTSGFVDRRQYQ